MKLLLDTHVWLWLEAEPARVPPRTLALLEDDGNELAFSAACAFEIATKHRLGKLPLPASPDAFVRDAIRALSASALPISLSHATRAGDLPAHHRDPFDRLLVAQAQLEELVLVTADEQLAPYDVRILWR